jgi:hypothetical protein
MRQLIGVGTPRGLQGRLLAVLAGLLMLIRPRRGSPTRHWSPVRRSSRIEQLSIARFTIASIGMREVAFTTGCYGMNERSSSRMTIGMSNKWIGSACGIRVPPEAKKSAIWP